MNQQSNGKKSKAGSKQLSKRSLMKGLFASVIGITLTVGAGSAFGFYQEYDRPTERARWRAEWHEEGSGQGVMKKEKNGGRLSAEFRKNMLEAADKERGKWGHMIPGVTKSGSEFGGAATGSTGATTSLMSIAATGSTWVNMGQHGANKSGRRKKWRHIFGEI